MIVASDMSLMFFRGQVGYLRAAGFDVTCISSEGPGQAIVAAEGARILSIEIPRRISPVKDVVALFRLWIVLRRIGPDIVNFGTPKGGLLGGVAGWLANVPHRVYTLHGLRLETERGWRRRLLRGTEKVTCACAQRVRAVSPSLRTRAVALGITSRERIYVLGSGSANGVDTVLFQATDERRRAAYELRTRLGIAADAQVVGFVGRITRDKGIRELEQAYLQLRERLPKLVLLLIGSVEGACPEDEALIHRCRRDRQILMLDAVTKPVNYYLLMDVLALPTYREGLANVLLEAQAMGVPVVTTCVTGGRDAVQDGITGRLVPVHDANALSSAVGALLGNRPERIEMGKAGRRWVESAFSCEAAWRMIEQDYRQMLVGEGDDPSVQHLPTKTFYMRFGKRLLDFVASTLLLFILAPLFLLLFVVVRATLGSPTIFRQVRPGKNGRLFTLLKFRTMTDTVDEQGLPRPDAERLTGVGRMLRSTSFDELPELLNVIRGEMSLVGPRPLLMEYLPLYTTRQMERHKVLPGITGWAQVSGRNRLNWQARLELDVTYAERPAFLWDLCILAMTLKRVLLREDVTHDGHVTMPKFQGAESD